MSRDHYYPHDAPNDGNVFTDSFTTSGSFSLGIAIETNILDSLFIVII